MLCFNSRIIFFFLCFFLSIPCLPLSVLAVVQALIWVAYRSPRKGLMMLFCPSGPSPLRTSSTSTAKPWWDAVLICFLRIIISRYCARRKYVEYWMNGHHGVVLCYMSVYCFTTTVCVFCDRSRSMYQPTFTSGSTWSLVTSRGAPQRWRPSTSSTTAHMRVKHPELIPYYQNLFNYYFKCKLFATMTSFLLVWCCRGSGPGRHHWWKGA